MGESVPTRINHPPKIGNVPPSPSVGLKKGWTSRKVHRKPGATGEVSMVWGRPLASVKGVPIRLVEKHGDHVTGWFHHLDHPLTLSCWYAEGGVRQGHHVRRACIPCSKRQGRPLERHLSGAKKSFSWPPLARAVPTPQHSKDQTYYRSGWRRGVPSPKLAGLRARAYAPTNLPIWHPPS